MYSQFKRFAFPIAIALNMAMNPTHAFAQTSRPDAWVKAALDANSIKYQVDKDNDFKITLDLGNGRTQSAIIRSRTEKIYKMEIREIFSPAYIVKGVLPADVSNKLLQASGTRYLGSWEVMQAGTKQMVVFSTKIQGKISSEDLITSLQYTMASADLMEKELTNGKDDF